MFAGKKSAQIREILISESAWEEMTCLFAPSLVLVPFTHEPLTNYPLWTISYELFGSLIVFCTLSLFGSFRYRMFAYLVIFLYFYVNVEYYYLFVFGLFLCDLHSNGMLKLGVKTRILMFILGLFLTTTPMPRDGVENYAGMFSYLKVLSSLDYLQVYRTLAMTGTMMLFTSLLGTRTAEITLREGANKQVISSQADSLIKISRIWADFFPANTSNQPI